MGNSRGESIMGTISSILPPGVVNVLKIGCREKWGNPFFKWVSNTTIIILQVYTEYNHIYRIQPYTTMKPLFHCTMFVKVENVNMCGIVQQYFTFGLQDYNHVWCIS